MDTSKSAENPPRFSILTAVFDPEPGHLEACLRSVREQTFGDWEHVLVDDGSTRPEVRALLAEANGDERIRVISRSEQGGIVAASSDALDHARGELIALLDHDDVLRLDALALMSAAFVDGIDVAYSDHDFLRPDGRHAAPSYKPDFSPERLRNQNYITHFLVARRALVERVGGFQTGFDGAQDHDLVLRLTEVADGVAHVPFVLYHWRQAPTSVSSSGTKPWAFEAGVRAVAAHCRRVGIDADVEMTEHEGCYRIRRHAADPQPLVSVVIPTCGSNGRVWGVTRTFVVEAVRSLIDRSTYTNLEFVVVADDHTPQRVLTELAAVAGDALRVVPFSGPFNFSAQMNAGVIAAGGDLLLMLNDDTELIEPTSVHVLVSHVLDGAAMAGAKLLFADGTLQHGGHVYHHDILHACFGWGGDHPGPWPLRALAVERECSGVTAAAAVVSREAFDAVGGFTTELPLNYNDVDLCLKIRSLGHRIVWSPHACWYHFESRTRDSKLLDAEYDFIDRRWHAEINSDPYYNQNLAPNRSDWLELPLRSGAPPLEVRPNALSRVVGARRT